jgi:protein kinase-like protein
MHRKDDFHEQRPHASPEHEDPPESGPVPQRHSDPAARAGSLPDADSLEPQGRSARERCLSLFPTPECLTDDEVLAFSEGRVCEARRAQVESHMDGCTTCQQLVQWAAWDIDASFSDSATLGWVTTFSKGRVVAGRYRITRFVARGGMGEVYEAYDKKLQERVALKTMLCASSDSPSALKRLCHEVQLARRIAHPNVCRTHELHEHKERKRARPPVHFVAMEYVDGETLADRLMRGPLPLHEALVIARQLLSGLEAAHSAGVLHLDFKSSNVMLRHGACQPHAVIMDFSLSRALDKAAQLRTSEHRFAGSAGYMSPEQLDRRGELGPASDLYSFGVVLFEMLTGRSPFPGDSLPAIIMQQLRARPPAPSSVVPALSPVLDAFVLKCLSREPGDRYPSIAAARVAFDEVAGDEVVRRREGRPFWPVVLGAALIGLVLSTVYLAKHEPPVGEPIARAPIVAEWALQPSVPLEPAPQPAPEQATPLERIPLEHGPLEHGPLETTAPPPAASGNDPVRRGTQQPKTRAVAAKKPTAQPGASTHDQEPAREAAPPVPQHNEPRRSEPQAGDEAPAQPSGEAWRPKKAPQNLL